MPWVGRGECPTHNVSREIPLCPASLRRVCSEEAQLHRQGGPGLNFSFTVWLWESGFPTLCLSVLVFTRLIPAIMY